MWGTITLTVLLATETSGYVQNIVQAALGRSIIAMSLLAAATQETSRRKPLKTFKGHTETVFGVIHLPDGKRIISCSEDGSLRLWNLKNGLQIGKHWQDGKSAVQTITLSPDGKTAASGSEDGTVRLWDIATGKVIAKWTGPSVSVLSICWSQDGRQVLSGSEDGAVRVWDVKSRKTTLQFEPTNPEHEDMLAMCPVVYSPDETMIASGGSGSDGRKIKIMNAKTLELVATLEEPKGNVWCLVWTKDGKTLVSGSGFGGGSIRKWNTTTWKQSAVLTEQRDFIRAVAISPNGRILASASYDRTARLWNLENDQPIGLPLQHVNYVCSVSFSANGGLLATCCVDNNAYTWDVSAIVKEAGLDELLLDSDVPQEFRPQNPATGRTSVIDATRHHAESLNNARRLPPKFFGETGDNIDSVSTQPLAHPMAPHSSVSRPRVFFSHISSLFRHSHSSIRDSTSHVAPTPPHPLNSAITKKFRWRHSDNERSEIEVPYTQGRARNVKVTRERKTNTPAPNNIVTINTASPSQSPISGDTQQPSDANCVQESSSQPKNLLTSTSLPLSTPPVASSPPDIARRQAGCWASFWSFVCCISSANSDSLR